MHRLLAVAVLAVTPALAWAGPIWKGNFETGDLSQWEGKQIVSPERMQVVQVAAPYGNRYAVKVTVKQGDNPINASGNRNELVHIKHEPEGAEYYYRWSTMFAPNYPTAYTWQVFTQWHQAEDWGYPPIQFTVYGEEIRLQVTQEEWLVWRAPLERGVWHDFIFHVRFSDDPSKGFVELWYDGKLVLPRTYGRTRANAYLKQGLYRNNTIAQDGVVYHAGMVQGLTLQDVMGAPTGPTQPTEPDVFWKGNFETGDLSQWRGKQMVSPDRIQVVTPPIPHDNNRYAVKVTVKQGDNPIGSSGNRSELVNPTYQPEGSESYYRWSTLFPMDYPSAQAWQVFAQWHQQADYGYPPLQFTVHGEEMRLYVTQDEQLVWKTPLVRGVWHDFIVHVKFSDSASQGFVEVWYDGKLVVPKRYVRTLANDYLKLGLYRSEAIWQDGVVYHMGMVQGRTLQAVLPKVPSGPDRVWTGSFSDGTLSQWDKVQAVAPDRMQVVQPQLKFDNNAHAVKVAVNPGDWTSSGNRSQLVRVRYEPEGADYFYRWGTFFTSDYPSTGTWQTFASFNPQDDVRAAPIQLRTVGEEVQLYLGLTQQVLWRAPLVRGTWHSFIVHVRFSDDPAKGFVELWYDGAQVLSKTYSRTLANDYLKLGLNRGGALTAPSVVYHAGMVQGRTLESVLPNYRPTN